MTAYCGQRGVEEIHQYAEVCAYHENADGTFNHVGVPPGLRLDTELRRQRQHRGGRPEEWQRVQSISVFTLPIAAGCRPPRLRTTSMRRPAASNRCRQWFFALASSISNYLYSRRPPANPSRCSPTATGAATSRPTSPPTAFGGADTAHVRTRRATGMCRASNWRSTCGID